MYPPETTFCPKVFAFLLLNCNPGSAAVDAIGQQAAGGSVKVAKLIFRCTAAGAVLPPCTAHIELSNLC